MAGNTVGNRYVVARPGWHTLQLASLVVQAAYYDFYQYGGIIREVTLHVLPTSSPSIQRVTVDPLAVARTKGKAPSGRCSVRVVVRACGCACVWPCALQGCGVVWTVTVQA